MARLPPRLPKMKMTTDNILMIIIVVLIVIIVVYWLMTSMKHRNVHESFVNDVIKGYDKIDGNVVMNSDYFQNTYKVSSNNYKGKQYSSVKDCAKDCTTQGCVAFDIRPQDDKYNCNFYGSKKLSIQKQKNIVNDILDENKKEESLADCANEDNQCDPDSSSVYYLTKLKPQ